MIKNLGDLMNYFLDITAAAIDRGNLLKRCCL